MSDVMTWKYEPEEDHGVAFIGEYTADGRLIRFVCEFIEPPTDEDAATLVAGKNELADLRAALSERDRMLGEAISVMRGQATVALQYGVQLVGIEGFLSAYDALKVVT